MKEINTIDVPEWRVLFSLENHQPPDDLYQYILITPWEKNWNDFGFKTDCFIRIFEFGDPTVLTGRLAFRPMRSSSYQTLKDKFRETSQRFVGAGEAGYLDKEVFPEFYTLLADIENYRELVRRFGVEKSKKILGAINDMALAKASRSKAAWFVSAQREKAFAESFIRQSDAFFAFNNGSFLIDGLEEERLDVVSSNLRLKFQLDNYVNPHELTFTFDKNSAIPKNVSIIIGRNGVGKSRALSKLVEAALHNDISTLSESGGDRPMLSRILALATPGETAHTFPSPLRSKRQNIYYRRLSFARGSTGTGADGLPDLVHQLARSTETIRSQSRWKLFVKAISSVLDTNSIAFRLYPEDDDTSYHYTFPLLCCAGLDDFISGNEARLLELRRRLVLSEPPKIHINGKLYPMSSGQIAFFRFALHACLYIENGTLVLLDEPETHLHPNLISEFMMLLNTLLSETGSIAIISTHSAYFVREVPRSQVLVLRSISEDGQYSITCDRPRLGTFGSNVGAISHFIFEDELSTSLMKLVETSLDAKGLEAMKDEISLESYIKISDRLAKRK